MYRIFDTRLECDFPLPELPQSPGGDCSFFVRMGEPALFDARGFEKTFEWCDYGGRMVCRCDRRGDEYRYVFAGHASYHVSAEGVISCRRHHESSMQMLRHLLLNQIIPRYLATSGRLVLHASAVMLENGKLLAFLGNSGLGKSTLASSFHRHGAQLISDDCIVLDSRGDGVTAMGSFPGIRLFPDSVQAVFDEAAGFSHYMPYSDKQQLLLQSEAGGVQAGPQRLDALFLLDDPAAIKPGAAVRIEPVPGSTAMMAMIDCAFSLDPSDKQMIARNFRNIGQAISERLGLYRLHYPRVHKRLSEVRQAIINCVRL